MTQNHTVGKVEVMFPPFVLNHQLPEDLHLTNKLMVVKLVCQKIHPLQLKVSIVSNVLMLTNFYDINVSANSMSNVNCQNPKRSFFFSKYF